MQALARQLHPRTAGLLLALALALAGCAGYQLGPTGGQTALERSIQVQFFDNRTLQPRLAEPVAQALRRTLQQDGTFRLVSRADDADVIVEGVLLEYDRRPLAYQPNDLVSVQEYELRLRARVIARNRLSNAVLHDAEIAGRTTVVVGDDLTSSERQAIPLLAQDLARNITTALAEGSW